MRKRYPKPRRSRRRGILSERVGRRADRLCQPDVHDLDLSARGNRNVTEFDIKARGYTSTSPPVPQLEPDCASAPRRKMLLVGTPLPYGSHLFCFGK